MADFLSMSVISGLELSFQQWRSPTKSSSRATITIVKTTLKRRRRSRKLSEKRLVSLWSPAKRPEICILRRNICNFSFCIVFHTMVSLLTSWYPKFKKKYFYPIVRLLKKYINKTLPCKMHFLKESSYVG